MSDLSPINRYYKRYLELKSNLSISSNAEIVLDLIQQKPTELNNFFMAGLGLSTLLLRLGAVIQLSAKLNDGNQENDALFMKQVLDNLRETLPSDTNWKKMWEISVTESAWKTPTEKINKNESLLFRFVTFRNQFVHQKIQLSEVYINQLHTAIQLFEEMEALYALFQPGTLVLKANQYHWEEAKRQTNLHPYLQVGGNLEEPYIFQGVYNKEKAELLNTQLGDHINPLFEPIQQSLRNGAGQVFDHSSRISSYQSCFFGREKESEKLLDFCKSNDEQNVLTVKSPAGMGKGALMADLIEKLKKENVQTLYHFCGAGLHNSLHAILYHFILQAKNGGFWKTEDEEILRKLDRLPSKYIDCIHLFQRLLDECINIVRKNETGNIVIILDALDEAQVASTQLKISDWFYTYNEKEEPESDWRSDSNIRWVFSYRCAEDGAENFYKFPTMKELATIEELQPLKGLSPEAVRVAFGEMVSEDFMQTLIEKAVI